MIYDIVNSPIPIDLDYVKQECVNTFTGSLKNVVVIRAIFSDSNKLLSALCVFRYIDYDTGRKDGYVMYFTTDELGPLETVTDPEHHHITIISPNPAEYLAAADLDQFILVTKRWDRDTIQKRLPNWTFYRTQGQDDHLHQEFRLKG